MRQLGMFAKYWQAGAVKTRLAAGIGDRQASEVYHGFLLALVERLRQVADRRMIVYTPQDQRSDFEALAGRQWSLEPQAAGDLGHRMSSFFASALARDNGSVVLIGSDSPTLPVEYVEDAFELLRESPVVLGPSLDGGYYLIGASRHIPCVFTDIAWSSSRVWDQTVSLLRRSECPYATLPRWYDVDELSDLRTLRTELTEMTDLDGALQLLQQTIERVLGELESGPAKGS